MGISVFHILIFSSILLLVVGAWQFLWIVIHKRGYELEKQEDESFPDFLFRYYKGEFLWELRKRFVPKWFYYSKMFLIFVKVKGTILILLGVVLSIVTLWLSNTEYAIWLWQVL